MVKGKQKLCKWCGDKLYNTREHECPKVFIHKLGINQITIRGNNLKLTWKGEAVVIRPT